MHLFKMGMLNNQKMLNRPQSATRWSVMGIINRTPDSFYDGGRLHHSIAYALDYCAQAIAGGATILDIGGESTRPGALPISVDEELERTIPLIELLHTRFEVTLSIDTQKSVVAAAAIRAGASLVNDISAGRYDTMMASVVAQSGSSVVLMHSRKSPQDMQENPHYDNPTQEVISELSASTNLFLSQGVASDSIILDPGIGFAKGLEDNLTLLRETSELVKLGYPVMIGTSRKSCIGAVTGKSVDQRLAGSLATIGHTYHAGATYFRVHDVAETVDYLRMLDAIGGGVNGQ